MDVDVWVDDKIPVWSVTGDRNELLLSNCNWYSTAPSISDQSKVGVFWFIAALFFTISMDGWPLFGFFGAEFIFIAGMVHVFIRRTEVVETVEITHEHVQVTRRDLKGVETKDFPAYWAQVHFDGSPTENAALEIRSHGEAIEIGRFLSASEKDRTAWKIADVLQRLRANVPLNTD